MANRNLPGLTRQPARLDRGHIDLARCGCVSSGISRLQPVARRALARPACQRLWMPDRLKSTSLVWSSLSRRGASHSSPLPLPVAQHGSMAGHDRPQQKRFTERLRADYRRKSLWSVYWKECRHPIFSRAIRRVDDKRIFVAAHQLKTHRLVNKMGSSCPVRHQVAGRRPRRSSDPGDRRPHS